MLRRLKQGIGGVVLLGLVVLTPSIWTWTSAIPHEHSVADVPEEPAALVLGASVYADGQPSPFLAARLEVARQLFEAGKVRAILVSGDNGSKGYDEPTAMKDWLVARGVPEHKVVADFAGFDTYDSCVRAKEIFGATRVTVVTQTYHLHRAVATCRAVGLEAEGVGDDTARSFRDTWWRGVAREVPACWKTVFDVATHRQPTLGPRETALDDAVNS